MSGRFNALTSNGDEALIVVTTTPQVVTTPQSRRELLYLENRSITPIFYGPSGSPLARLSFRQSVFLPITKDIEITVVTSVGTADLVVQEYE